MEEQEFDFKKYQSLKGRAAFEQRVNHGLQPVVDIAGQPYYVNVRIGLLEPADLTNDAIRLYDLKRDQRTGDLFFYCTGDSRQLLPYPDPGTGLPAGAFKVDIPHEYYLDPVGMARKNGKEDLRYYMHGHTVGAGFLLKMYHKAKITPVGKQLSTGEGLKTATKTKAKNKPRGL